MVTRLEPSDRTCPDCHTTFASVQFLGVCPNCDLRFGVDATGRVIAPGDRPSDRSKPKPLYVPPNIDDLTAVLPDELVARVRSEFAPEDVSAVLRLLACYGTRRHEQSPDEVRSRILDNSNGFLRGVESLILVAQADWRDIIR